MSTNKKKTLVIVFCLILLVLIVDFTTLRGCHSGEGRWECDKAAATSNSLQYIRSDIEMLEKDSNFSYGTVCEMEPIKKVLSQFLDLNEEFSFVDESQSSFDLGVCHDSEEGFVIASPVPTVDTRPRVLFWTKPPLDKSYCIDVEMSSRVIPPGSIGPYDVTCD